MRDLVWLFEPKGTQRLAFESWSFSLLAIDIPNLEMSARDANARARNFPDSFFLNEFSDELELADSGRWWTGLEKIELRVPTSFETSFRRCYEAAVKAAPLSVMEKKILPLIVFIGENGEESKLVEEDTAL